MPRRKANGEGSIRQLPNGKYKATMTVDIIYNPDNTVQKQNRKSFTHEKKGECQKWLNEQINQKNKETLVRPSKTTVEQWLNNWLEKYKKNNLKPRTYEGYKTIIDVHLIPAIGKKNLQSLKTSDLQKLYSEKIKSGKSARTVEYIHTVIHGALKQASKEGLIPKNISEHCELPKAQKKEMNVFTQEEITKLLVANKDHKYYSLLLLDLGTGLRRSELLALHWKHINFETNILYVEGSLSETKQGVILLPPKTKSSVRAIPIPIEVMEELKRYKEQQADYIANHPNYKDKGIVFAARNGDYMRPSTLTQTFKYRWLRNAGLKGKSFHTLRHTHATMLLGMNVHAKIMQQRLGHSNISTTLDIYSHALPHMQQEASDKINEVLKI